MYRDAGFQGDSLCRTLLKELPSFLEEGGFATLQCNWAHGADDAWHAPVGECLAGSGCDAIVLRISTDEPLLYAARWSESDHPGDAAAFGDQIERWSASYTEAGIERITGAMVVIRKRTNGGANWRRAATINSLPEGLGERLPKLFADQERVDSEDLRAAALQARRRHRRRALASGRGRGRPRRARLQSRPRRPSRRSSPPIDRLGG